MPKGFIYQPVMASFSYFRDIFKWNSSVPSDGKPFHGLWAVTIGGVQVGYLLVFNAVWIAMLIITVVKGVRLMSADERERPEAKRAIINQVIGILALGLIVNVVSRAFTLLQ